MYTEWVTDGVDVFSVFGVETMDQEHQTMNSRDERVYEKWVGYTRSDAVKTIERARRCLDLAFPRKKRMAIPELQWKWKWQREQNKESAMRCKNCSILKKSSI